MEKTNRKSNHIKKISSLCPIKKVYYFCCCFEFFAPFIQIKWLYNICSTTCLAAPFKEALNQKGVFLTFYTMWCAGGWFPSFKCDEYFMTTGNCQAVWRLDGWGWRKKKVSYSRRTCCFYLLLNTWFVFCFPRVCILVYMDVLPKKGEIFTAWLWPHCHNYDVAGEYLSSLADVWGELWCVCDDVVLVPLLLFFDRCRIMDNLL